MSGNGKAAKQENNKKKEKNDLIETEITKYFMEFGEMPSYMYNFGMQVQDRYRQQFSMMLTQFGVVAANLRTIEEIVNDSKLTKKDKKKIIDLISVSMGEEGDGN